MFSTFPSSSQRLVVLYHSVIPGLGFFVKRQVYYFPISIWVLGVVIEIGQDKDRERLWPGCHLRLRSPLFYRLSHTARRPRVLKKLRQSNDHERVPLESDTSPMSVSQIRDPSLKIQLSVFTHVKSRRSITRNCLLHGGIQLRNG